MSSLLVPELSQALHRLVVITPTEKDLHAFLEAAAFELTTELGAGQALDLRSTSLKEGPLRAWMSFTLGRRGQLDVRLTCLGFVLEEGYPEPELLDTADGYILYMPPGRRPTDEIFRLNWSPEACRRPAALMGMAAAKDSDLQAQALRQWAFRHFPYLLEIPDEEKPLGRSLDWLLSF